jgi:hypothetical protein
VSASVLKQLIITTWLAGCVPIRQQCGYGSERKCRSQCLFAYFNLQTTMRDTSFSLLSFTFYRLLLTDVRHQSHSSSCHLYLVQHRHSLARQILGANINTAYSEHIYNCIHRSKSTKPHSATYAYPLAIGRHTRPYIQPTTQNNDTIVHE